MYKEVIRPALDFLDRTNILPSEESHTLVKKFFHYSGAHPLTLVLFEKIFAYQGKRFTDDRLKVNVGGLELDNPVMIGAGWDKEGKAVKALWQLGASAVTVGTVTENPQYGNPKKRQFVLEPGVVLNRLGFNSPGMEIVAQNLKKYKESKISIGVSVGKNKDVPLEDASETHARVVKLLYPYASYFEFNCSSPNTPDLRKLQDKHFLIDNVQAINQTMEEMGGIKPLGIKIAPDNTLGAVDDITEVAIDNKVPIIIVGNTTINSDIKAKYGEQWRNEPGGVSGDDEDFRAMSNKIIAHIFRETNGQVDIIGVGGVNDARSALKKIVYGAKAVQIVTGLREKGTTLPGEINNVLAQLIAITKCSSIQDMVGISAKQVQSKFYCFQTRTRNSGL